jgi:hypothetical protein
MEARELERLMDDSFYMNWNPTPEQFARYKAREIEMAKRNASIGMGTTLHSDGTLYAAGVRQRGQVFTAPPATYAPGPSRRTRG